MLRNSAQRTWEQEGTAKQTTSVEDWSDNVIADEHEQRRSHSDSIFQHISGGARMPHLCDMRL